LPDPAHRPTGRPADKVLPSSAGMRPERVPRRLGKAPLDEAGLIDSADPGTRPWQLSYRKSVSLVGQGWAGQDRPGGPWLRRQAGSGRCADRPARVCILQRVWHEVLCLRRSMRSTHL